MRDRCFSEGHVRCFELELGYLVDLRHVPKDKHPTLLVVVDEWRGKQNHVHALGFFTL